MKVRIVCAATVLAAASLVATSAFAMTAMTIRGAAIRAGAGPNFPKLGMLKAGTRIMVHSCDGMWCGVLLNGHRAYIEEAILNLPDGAPSIFDRWGELFVTEDSLGHQGQPLPATRARTRRTTPRARAAQLARTSGPAPAGGSATPSWHPREPNQLLLEATT